MSIKDLPQGLIDAASEVIAESNREEALQEASPPDAKIEKWIMANKEKFHQEYKERGDQVLYAKAWDMYNKKEDFSVEEESLSENLAISPKDLSVGEALGQSSEEHPKHVDVVTETDLRVETTYGDKKEGFRLLCQYSTNTMPKYVPSLEFPPAPTLEALVALIPGEPSVVEAIVKAADLPHERYNFKGQPPLK